MIRSGNNYDRKFQRLRPGEHVGERHRFIARTVNDDGIAGDCPGFVFARTLYVSGGRTYQHQPLRRMMSLGKRLRRKRPATTPTATTQWTRLTQPRLKRKSRFFIILLKRISIMK